MLFTLSEDAEIRVGRVRAIAEGKLPPDCIFNLLETFLFHSDKSDRERRHLTFLRNKMSFHELFDKSNQ